MEALSLFLRSIPGSPPSPGASCEATEQLVMVSFWFGFGFESLVLVRGKRDPLQFTTKPPIQAIGAKHGFAAFSLWRTPPEMAGSPGFLTTRVPQTNESRNHLDSKLRGSPKVSFGSLKPPNHPSCNDTPHLSRFLECQTRRRLGYAVAPATATEIRNIYSKLPAQHVSAKGRWEPTYPSDSYLLKVSKGLPPFTNSTIGEGSPIVAKRLGSTR